MFSSVLPGVSANMNFMHNPSSKPNRYVKSSANPNVPYIANPNLYDVGYLSILPAEGVPSNWYPNNSYNSPYGQDYAIYSTPIANPFNYDQSPPFLDFEDASSITTDSTASPALSTDSLETLKSPVESESLTDELDIHQSENRTSFPFPIPSEVGRSLSTHPPGDHFSGQQFSPNITPFQSVAGEIPRVLHPPFDIDLVGDSQNTLWELEVEERDRIAKMNAEYNAVSHPAFFRHGTSSQTPMYSTDRIRESNTTPQLSSMQTRPSLPLSATQPRHPDLPIFQRPIGNEKDYHIYAPDLSSPSVERLPSQFPPEQNENVNRNLVQLQSSPPAGSRSRDNSDRSRLRKHTSSVLITDGHSSPSLDAQESHQYKQRSRLDASLIQSTTAKSQAPHHTSPDSRQNADVPKSIPAQVNEATELEYPERISLGSYLRKDTKTPGPSARGPSYVQSSRDSPLRSPRDIHSSPNMRDQESQKSSPRLLDDKTGHDDGRSPSEAKVSALPREYPSSVSQSSWLAHEDVSRQSTKIANVDRESEGNKRLRATGTERPAVSKHVDESFRGTAPNMHTQGLLHLSPESSLVAIPQPESQVTPVSVPRSKDLHHSKAVYDQASPPKSPESRESLKVRESLYGNPARLQPDATKREGPDVRMPSSPTVIPEPHRRRSDGDQVGPPVRPPLSGRNSVPLVRSVRWTENLIAPSPIMGPARRKGWFNRRGDQLWTNTGDYRPPRTGEEYPLDLDGYPEPGDGWMNEDGVRIDMDHRRIPKVLPRPALKKP